MSKLLAVVVLAMPWARAVHSQEPAEIAAWLRSRLESDDIPGMSCAVAVGDRIVFAQGFGIADLENDVPATEHTVYRLASISKPITAVLAMQLVEQGKLKLDTPVHTIVDAWPQKRWPVTTRQLLGHLGGVRHYKPFEGESTRRYANQTAALDRFASDRLRHQPGTKYLYSTYGFNLAAAVVEARAGEPFATVVKQRIAAPCGADSLQDDDLERLIKGRAQGYVRKGGELRNSKLMDASYKLGGGGLCASAPDLVRFAQALMAGKLVGEQSLQLLWEPQRTSGGESTGYGLGFAVATVNGVRVVQHGGAQSRVSTHLCMLPEHRVAVAILCNLERVRLGKLGRRIALSLRGVREGK